MPYSDFNLDRACKAFDLRVEDRLDLFHDVPERPIGPWLQSTLEESVSLAMAINTEKARSELIVSPILLDVRRQLGHRISFFSGVELNVAPERGLNGVCDFIISKSPSQWILSVPIMVLVEAKRDNLKDGLGQCVAAMFASRLFNERESGTVTTVFGAVTTGTLWQFLRLDGPTLEIDAREYHIERADKIVGILEWILTDEGDRGRLVA